MFSVSYLPILLVTAMVAPSVTAQTPESAPASASANLTGPVMKQSERAPSASDRPKLRDTCERRTGMPIIHLRGGDDHLYGGAAAYQMFGDEGRDFLLGSSEDDEINGGDDADILIGGGGADLFVYDTRFASLAEKNGRWSPETGDTIVDFEERDRDKIDLRPMKKYGLNAPTTLFWSEAGAAEYAVWTMPKDRDTIILMDLDGDARADSAFRLLGERRLTAASFCGVENNEGSD